MASDPAFSHRGLDLVRTEEAPSCPRCGGEGLLSVSVPHEWRNNRGATVPGFGAVVLCPRCDGHDPAAAPLITFFTVHGQVSEDTAEEFTALVHTWAAHARVPEPDPVALEREAEAWRRGELDDDEPAAPGPYLVGDDRLHWPDTPDDDWP